jgi:thiol:disulfide interchange protein DsbC
MMLRALLFVLFSISFAHAAETDSSAKLKTLLSKAVGEVAQINKSPIAGLYEVVTQDHVFYTDESGQYLIDGSLFDLKTRRNVTEARTRQLFALDFSQLPFDLAIKKVKGNGSRKLAYFTDPNCGFCKKLEHELQSVNDVTIYFFLYPIFEGSAEKVQGVWCSKDRVKAWDNLMLNGVMPAAGKCDTPVAKIKELAKKLKVNGTPALIFANGMITPGYLSAADLEKELNSNK